jgi:tRNA 5-methylaminomethyl-2-thiouridine biosynthesis bifunctional protein
MPARPLQLASSELLAAWRARADPITAALQGVPECLREQRSATVLDLHFGLGQSFFATWHAFARQRAQGRRGASALHRHPAASAVCRCPPRRLNLCTGLARGMALPLPGTHRLLLDEGRVTLTLIWGAVEEELARLDAPVDLFYLHADPTRFDPAAPAWHAHACKRLARLAWTGARALVFGAADVALAAAMRQVGFHGEARDGALALRYAPAWARPATHVAASDTPLRRDLPHARQALVIGAGLAGTAAAERLTARGWRIDLIDAGPEVATRASGNHGGSSCRRWHAMTARWHGSRGRPSCLPRSVWMIWAGWGWRITRPFVASAAASCNSGAMPSRRSPSSRARKWQYPPRYARWMSAGETANVLGMPTMGGGYFFPEAGWLNPPSVCRRLLAVAQAQGEVRTHFNRAVARLVRVHDQWKAVDADGVLIAQAPVVILAAGAQARVLEQAAGLPLNAVRGQVTHLPATGFPDLPHALCGDGYLTRPYAGQVCMGASYDRFDDPALRADSHAENLARLQHMLPQIAAHMSLPQADAHLPGRVGQRCIAPDRLPLVGALPGRRACMACWAMPRAA